MNWWPFSKRNSRTGVIARTLVVRAKFDSAQTTPDNRRHWANADGLSADAAANADVRRTLRNRARYEVANNSYARGIVLTLANDVIGTGPQLQMLTDGTEVNQTIEREFGAWAKAVDLPGKLRTMRQARTQDGEAFAVQFSNDQLDSPIKLDLKLIEADQVATPSAKRLRDAGTDGIVFDSFGNPKEYHILKAHPGSGTATGALDFRVDHKGLVYDDEGNANGIAGARRAILSDLAPIASFIASRYNDFQTSAFGPGAVTDALTDLGRRFAHFYATQHPDTGQPGTTRFYVWSEVFSCPQCSNATTLFDFAVDRTTYTLASTFCCPSCNTELSKDALERVWRTVANPFGAGTLKEARSDLVEVCAQIDDNSYRYEPTHYDRKAIAEVPPAAYAWVPTDEFPHGRQTRKIKSGSGITTISQMFTPRALLLASHAWEILRGLDMPRDRWAGMFLFSSSLALISRRERFRDGTGKGAQSGTLYVPSIQVEKNAFDVMGRKLSSYQALGFQTDRDAATVTCQSHADERTIPSNSIDYIFTDPPFGESLQYGELNFFHEAWLKVRTRIEDDCVLNYVHDKSLAFYQDLMRRAFTEAYRILKPGRWITVEFHNSQNSVWMAIQEAMWQSGFTVADVRVLDKQQGTFNVVNRAGAVKQDLIISAYKANDGLEERFRLEAGTAEGVWDFTRTHLRQLPVFVAADGKSEIIVERQNFLIFDRMVAFHVQRGVTVSLSAAEFYQGLVQRFAERDGMYFLSDQVAEYDRKRMSVKEVLQLKLFVTDEASAIQWLKQQLSRKPQTFQELHPQFLKKICGWEKHERPLELSALLEENFLCYHGKGEVPSQIHSYLSTNFKDLRNKPKGDPALKAKAEDRYYVPDPNKAGDLEKLRERGLLREFEEYKERTKRFKRSEKFRMEAVRTGFKHCWQNRDYETIIAVAQRLPEKILQEDPKLLMWYDQALTRTGGDA